MTDWGIIIWALIALPVAFTLYIAAAILIANDTTHLHCADLSDEWPL